MPLIAKHGKPMRSFINLIIASILIQICTVSLSSNNDEDESISDSRYIYTTDGLFLREGPGMRHKKLALLPYMTEVQFYSRKDKPELIKGIAGYWTEVEAPDGTKGWVFSGFLSNRKARLNKSDLISDTSSKEISRKIRVFLKAHHTGLTHFEISNSDFSGVNFSIVLSYFTEKDHVEKNCYEDIYWSIDHMKDRAGFEKMQPGSHGKSGHATYWGGWPYRVILIKNRKYECIQRNFNPSSDFYIEYITFIDNIKFSYIISFHSTYLFNYFINDLFVDLENTGSIHYTMKGKEFMGYVEEQAYDFSEIAAAEMK